MKEHANIYASLLGLALIVGTLIVLVFHGMADATVVVVLATGSVGIAQSIAGIKTNPTPGTTSVTSNSIPTEPIPPPITAPAAKHTDVPILVVPPSV